MSSDYVTNNQGKASTILRAIALSATLASGIFFSFFLFKESESASAVAIFLLPGPLLVTAGIVISFIYQKRPAVLKIETTLGLIITFIGGVFGAFSIGGILVLGLFISVPTLLIDGFLRGFANLHGKAIPFMHKIFILLAQLIFTSILLFLVANEAIGFFILIFPVVIIWNVLLYFSIRSYLPDQWIILVVWTLFILAAFFLVVYFQKNQPDFWANISSSSTSATSSLGGSSQALGSNSGSTGSETIEINYQELNTHKDWLKFNFNGSAYWIKSSSRTVFYGLLSQDADYIILQLSDGSKLKNRVKDRMFVIESSKTEAENKLVKIMLVDKNGQIKLVEEI